MDQSKIALMFATLFISATAVCSASPAKAESNSGTGKITQSGQASWYGPGLHGRRTANGETFNTNEFTAAHRTLPFGTRVRVVNKKTGKSVVVRINDRGPYARGRVIDLSRASAQAIGLSGVGSVDLAPI